MPLPKTLKELKVSWGKETSDEYALREKGTR